MAIGAKLKKILKDKKMTVKQLSIDSGVSENTLYGIIKRDNNSLRPSIAMKIANVLEIEAYELMGISPARIVEPGDPEYMQFEDSIQEYTWGEKVSDPTGEIAMNHNQRMAKEVNELFSQGKAWAQGEQYKRRKDKLQNAFNQLNETGQNKAVERVEELTEIPKYRQAPEAHSDP